MISSPLWGLSRRSNRQVEVVEEEKSENNEFVGSPVWIRSNFCSSVDPLIEHAGVYCFQSDSSALWPLSRVGTQVGFELPTPVSKNRTSPVIRGS